MYLGIEIGGTKLQLGLGTGNGSIEALWRGEVDVSRGGEGIRERIVETVPQLLQQAGLAKCHLHGVGVGFGGPVDDAENRVIKSHQISGWDDFPLADWLSDTLDGLPVILGNDADVAGLAEALFGAGKGMTPVFYITIGSGIGGGLIIHGEIYRGVGRGAAEIGHLRVEQDSATEKALTVESLASGWGMENTARTLLGNPSANIKSQDIAERARAGDERCQRVLDVAIDTLAEAIVRIITLLCPRRIVIGGGVSLMGEELLFRPLRQRVAETVFKPFADCYDIVPATLGEEVVVHGALALAKNTFGKQRP